jgi:hypothetical protein
VAGDPKINIKEGARLEGDNKAGIGKKTAAETLYPTHHKMRQTDKRKG